LNGLDTIKIDDIKAGYKFSSLQNCGATSIQFTDTSRNFFPIASWQWKFGDGTSSTQQNPQHTYTTSNTYTIQLIATTTSGCSDTITKLIYIKVNNKPVNVIAAPVQGCTENTINYLGQINSVDSVTIVNWIFSNGYTSNGYNSSNVYIQTGTYTATLISATIYGCTDTTKHTITINPTPNVVTNTDRFICKGQSLQLNVIGANTYTWSPINGSLSCINCSNPIATPLSTTQYIVTGTTAAGCSDMDTVTISVAQPIRLTVSPSDTICIGSSTQLSASGASTYLWSPALALNQVTSATPIATPIVTTKYQVIGFDNYNCFQDTGYVTVAVGQYPTVNLGIDKTLATGTQFPLMSTITNGPITKWLWTPATDLNCTTCPQPIATAKKGICYSVVATNQFYCSATDTICIKVFCENTQVFIPNGFTPDGDGINDVLMVRGTGIKLVKNFRIFNRWGQVVFEKNNFIPNDISSGWDGTFNGKPALPDVYVYTCDVTCENDISYNYKGNVSIIK
jgi:gliding motility-associated-like protein